MLKLSLNPKRLVMVGGVLVCAFGTGLLMQTVLVDGESHESVAVASTGVVQSFGVLTSTGDDRDLILTPAPEVAAATPQKRPDDTLGMSQEESVLLDPAPAEEISQLPVTAPQPSALPQEPVTLAAITDDPVRNLPEEKPGPSFACDITVMGWADGAAMVSLTLSAPCSPNERFTVHHNGMMFTAITDEEGLWSGPVPALTQNALFIVAFPNGEGGLVTVAVDDIGDYDRVVLQWRGRSGLQIHAYEFGAEIGDQGHIWGAVTGTQTGALAGEGGFITQLGDSASNDALMAEIYTFPTARAIRSGEIKLRLETEVSGDTCGRDIEAQAIIRSTAGPLSARDLIIAMPDCDAVGEFLVLKNLYEDLTIAAK